MTPTSVLAVTVDAYLLVALLWGVSMWQGYRRVLSGDGGWWPWRLVKCAVGGLLWFPVILWVLYLLGRVLCKSIRDHWEV